jgi:hypothetical protein
MAVDSIYGEDESFEVETPDFHFNWLAAGDREGDKSTTPPPAKTWEKVGTAAASLPP